MSKYIDNLKKRFKNFSAVHADRIRKTKIFFLTIISFGILINYMLFVVANVPFTWYGFPAFGIIYYLITEEFVAFFRKLKAKVYT
jgi:hypothetical protein